MGYICLKHVLYLFISVQTGVFVCVYIIEFFLLESRALVIIFAQMWFLFFFKTGINIAVQNHCRLHRYKWMLQLECGSMRGPGRWVHTLQGCENDVHNQQSSCNCLLRGSCSRTCSVSCCLLWSFLRHFFLFLLRICKIYFQYYCT